MKPVVIILGIVFAIVGIVVGTSDLSVTQNGETANCASAFGKGTVDGANAREKDQLNGIASTLGGDRTTFDAACEGKKNTFRILSGVAGVFGVGLLIAGLFIPRRRVEVQKQ